MDGLLTYLDQQVEAIAAHAPAALEAFDEKGVHQARVATRRLKAGLELLEPMLGKAEKPLGRAGRKLRRRLGPLRDLDVMIGLVAEQADSAGIAWLLETLEKQRRDLRLHHYGKSAKPEKIVARFDGWWKLRHDLQADLAALEPLLTAALHERFELFARQADWISGVASPPEEALPIDVHQVRIEGKALRYTLEMADAGGMKLPKHVHRSFKAMQQSLGDWHDHVVLYETTLSLIVEHELALHEPELASQTLDLAKRFLGRSVKSLAGFRQQWKKSGAELSSALTDIAPLISAVKIDLPAPHEPIAELEAEPVIESQTDLDPPPTETSEPPALSPEDAQRAT